MGSDIARVSYDSKQHYRSVVMQQGRVTLEADWNEDQAIFGEELRQETLEIVGRAGTPDNGYEVLPSAGAKPYDFLVRNGTMYVGGARVELDARTDYMTQPEWLDYWNDPDWVDPEKLREKPATEWVYLFLREQEVSAVEDAALREVALGGPDTAARSRIIQHIVRLQTRSKDCAGGLAAAIEAWAAEGLRFNRRTMRLMPASTLEVSFPPAPKPEPCEPEAVGGYLGADNQLIRVQISGSNRLVWGYDDASSLYRVDIDSTRKTLHLQTRPIDAAHQPQANQAVEALASAAKLANGEYVASATGVVQTLTAAYNTDTQSITLPTELSPSYRDSTLTPRAFLRVWQQELQFTPGTPVALGDTGLMVTLNTQAGAPFHVGDYWQIAVRPSTPTKVYPQRYLDRPQPPDGPRMWACPLAAIEWQKEGTLQIDEDCRNQFDNLVDLTKNRAGGCCTVSVSPDTLTGGTTLQSIIEKYANHEQVTICLMPGVYNLPRTLVLGNQNSNLTIEGCHTGVILRAAAGAEANFLHGLVLLNQADNVTLRGLQFEQPLIPFAKAGGVLAGLDTATLESAGIDINTLASSIAVRPVGCRNLTVERCVFQFAGSVTASEMNTFGAGILAGARCAGLKVEGNTFVSARGVHGNRTGPLQILVGYMLAPSVTITVSTTQTGAAPARRAPTLVAEAPAMPVSPIEPATIIGRAAPRSTTPTTPPGGPAQPSAPAQLPPPAHPTTPPAPGAEIAEAAARLSAIPASRLLATPLHLTSNIAMRPVGSAQEIGFGGTVLPAVLQNAEFRNDTFQNLNAAVVVFADYGSIRFEANSVRQCYAGFWLEAIKIGPLWNMGLLALASGGTMPLEPLTLIGTGLATAYPLPSGFDPSSGMIQVQPVAFTPLPSPAGLSPLQQGLFALGQVEAVVEFVGLSKYENTQVSVPTASNNDIDAIGLGFDQKTSGLSGSGLLLLVEFASRQTTQPTVILSSNRIANGNSSAFLSGAIIVGGIGITITGNNISNLIGPSLIVETTHSSSDEFSATGNYLRGPTNLATGNAVAPLAPRSGYNAPLDSWVFANSVQ
jgi:hypothetical protein